jgi:hypothetical protein
MIMHRETVHRRFAKVFLVFCVLFLGISISQAQVLPVSGIQLMTNPQFPAPYGQVRVSLDDYSVNALGATITWYVNSIEQTEFQNERSILITAGDLGEKTAVRAVLTGSGSAPLSASIAFAPSVVDIIMEANTYVPAFYKGRPMPSSGATVRAIAVVHDGTNTSDASYTYQWSQNDNVLLGGPIVGKNVVEITTRYANDPLAVEVYDSRGTLVGRGVTELTSFEPEIHFYENSPLRGLSEKEATDPYLLIGEETTLYGEPFFLDIETVNDADFVWEVDRVPSPHDEKTPNALSLHTEGGAGNALLDLVVVTKKRIPQYVQKSLQLFFE